MRGQRVLDLGAGLGICSLAAAQRGARAVAAEIEPALATLRESVARNGSPSGVSVVEMPWGEPLKSACPELFGARDAEPFDLVVGADLLYNPGLYPLLLPTVLELLEPGGASSKRPVVYMCYMERGAEERFFNGAREAGVVCEPVALEPPLPVGTPASSMGGAEGGGSAGGGSAGGGSAGGGGGLSLGARPTPCTPGPRLTSYAC